MGTFRAYLKKEMLESSRQYRYLILALGLIFFAIADPIMMKLLPEMLKSQLGEAAVKLFVVTRRSELQGLVKDLFQIGSMVVVFSTCGAMSDEISAQKLVFPYAKGARPWAIVLAKALHYGVVIAAITFCAFGINYYYAGLLLTGESVAFGYVMGSAALMAGYFFCIMLLTLLLSSVIKKGIGAGILVLAISYFSTLLFGIKAVKDFLPYNLVDSASALGGLDTVRGVVIVAIYCVVFLFLTVYRMNKVEVI